MHTVRHLPTDFPTGARPADIADIALRYQVTEDTWRLGEAWDAPASLRTFENRCPDFALTQSSQRYDHCVDFRPLQGAVLSPLARRWAITQVEEIVETITGRLQELTREDLLWGGQGVALMFMKLGRRHADMEGFVPNHVMYARIACSTISEASLRLADAQQRAHEREGNSSFGYEDPTPGVDVSPVVGCLGLAHFELIQAYMSSIIKNSYQVRCQKLETQLVPPETKVTHESQVQDCRDQAAAQEAARKNHVRKFRSLEGEILELESDEWMQGRTMYLLCALQLMSSFPGDGILPGAVERICAAIYERSERTADALHDDRLAPPPSSSMLAMSIGCHAGLGRPAADGLNARMPQLMVATKDGLPWSGCLRGLAGLLHALLEVPPEILVKAVPSEERLAKIRQSVDWILSQEKESGVYSCVFFSEPGEKPTWADGSGGLCMLFSKAYEHFHDPKYAYAAQRCGERLWTYALARGSSGLLNGIAGNGYCFLRLFNCMRGAVKRAAFPPTTSPEAWLHRAYMCARFIVDAGPAAGRPAEFELSLADGSAGLVCFFLDLLEPGDAVFPLFEIGRF